MAPRYSRDKMTVNISYGIRYLIQSHSPGVAEIIQSGEVYHCFSNIWIFNHDVVQLTEVCRNSNVVFFVDCGKIAQPSDHIFNTDRPTQVRLTVPLSQLVFSRVVLPEAASVSCRLL